MIRNFIFNHFGETGPGVQAALMWKENFLQGKTEAKASAKAESSTWRIKLKISLKVGPRARRLKTSATVIKPASSSEEPEPHAETLTPSVDIASGNVNYAAVVASTSHATTATQ